jgi:zinc protease
LDRLCIVLVDKPGTPQSSIRIGCQAIARKSPDYYRALLANHILGGAFRRLSMSLREDKGWTYGVTSEIDARREVGPWTIGGEFVAAHTADAVVEILRQVDRLGRELVPAQELADAQAELIGAYPASLASAGQVVDKLTTLAIDEMPARTLERFVDGIKHVDSAQILDVARRYFRAGQLVVVIVGDGASIEAGLRKIGEVERRDLDGNLINPGHKEDAHERIDSSSSSDKARGPTGLVSPAAGADCARTRCGAVLRLRGHGLEQRVRHLGHLRQEGRRIATGHR